MDISYPTGTVAYASDNGAAALLAARPKDYSKLSVGHRHTAVAGLLAQEVTSFYGLVPGGTGAYGALLYCHSLQDSAGHKHLVIVEGGMPIPGFATLYIRVFPPPELFHGWTAYRLKRIDGLDLGIRSDNLSLRYGAHSPDDESAFEIPFESDQILRRIVCRLRGDGQVDVRVEGPIAPISETGK
jgi:hypothetical protein